MRTGKYSIKLAAFGLACFAAASAGAASVSYTFAQGGWTDAAGDAGTLTGTFTGTAEANGDLQLADLSSFQANFHESGPLGTNTFIFNLVTTTNFLYDPAAGLDFAAGSAASNIQLCSGPNSTNFICFGLNPNGGVRTVLNGFFDDLPKFGQTTTRSGVTVTPVANAAPEPGSLGLLTAAGVTLLGCGVVKRRRFVR